MSDLCLKARSRVPSNTIEAFPFDRDVFFRSLQSEFITPEQVRRHGRASYLFDYLTAIKAKTLVVEHEYTDGDYLDDYANYYVRSFADYPRRCKRLHFFSASFDAGMLEAELLGEPAAEFHGSYLGFVVVRPLPNAIIGRTVLSTYPELPGQRHYPSVREYGANLFGTGLTIRSLAFQEQDTVIAACATVALWSAFQKASVLFGTRMPTPADITRSATSATFQSRPLPSRGLNLTQIARAVRDAGLEPEVIQCGPRVPLLSLICGYLEFGLPVVLGIQIEGRGLHAVTVTGYSIQKERVLTREDSLPKAFSFNRVGLRVDQLFVHDDGFGPFVKIAARNNLTENECAVYFDGTWKLPGGSDQLARLTPLWVVVPAYHKIRLTFLDIQEWITRFNLVVAQTLKDMAPTEWKIVLRDTNTMKTEVKAWGSPDQVRGILFRQLPRFLWRATLSVDQVPAVEMLFDATGIARSFTVLEVVFRDEGFRAAIRPVLETPTARKWLGEQFAERALLAVQDGAEAPSPAPPP